MATATIANATAQVVEGHLEPIEGSGDTLRGGVTMSTVELVNLFKAGQEEQTRAKGFLAMLARTSPDDVAKVLGKEKGASKPAFVLEATSQGAMSEGTASKLLSNFRAIVKTYNSMIDPKDREYLTLYGWHDLVSHCVTVNSGIRKDNTVAKKLTAKEQAIGHAVSNKLDGETTEQAAERGEQEYEDSLSKAEQDKIYEKIQSAMLKLSDANLQKLWEQIGQILGLEVIQQEQE